MIGEDKDGSDDILSAFCQACITGEQGENIVEEAYSSTILSLLGNQSIKSNKE